MTQVAAYTSVPAVKAYLRIDSTVTTDDGLLRSLVDTANMVVAQALSRNVLSADYTETRNGTGTKSLVLTNYPITAVSSVELVGPAMIAGAPQPSATLTEGVDFTVGSYALQMLYGVWPKGRANVKVSYTAGYASMPADLAHAGTKLAALRYRELERLGQKSKSMGGEIISYDTDEMPPDVAAIIERYKLAFPLAGSIAGTV